MSTLRVIPGFKMTSRRRRGRFGTAFLGIALILAIVGTPWLVQGGFADQLLTAAAWALFLAGALLRWWAMLYVAGRKGKELQTIGPYAAMRHPLYVGSFLIGLSAALFLDSVVILAGVLVTAVVYAVYVIPLEEGRILARFGEQYAEYCNRTARFIPHAVPAGLMAGPGNVDMVAMRTELSRAVWWLLIPLFNILVTLARVQPWWPHLLPVP